MITRETIQENEKRFSIGLLQKVDGLEISD